MVAEVPEEEEVLEDHGDDDDVDDHRIHRHMVNELFWFWERQKCGYQVFHLAEFL